MRIVLVPRNNVPVGLWLDVAVAGEVHLDPVVGADAARHRGDELDVGGGKTGRISYYPRPSSAVMSVIAREPLDRRIGGSPARRVGRGADPWTRNGGLPRGRPRAARG